MIREIVASEEIRISAGVIRESFGTVASEFGLTVENAPTNPAFITEDRLEELNANGIRFFGFFEDDKLVGVVGLERLNDGNCVMEKLAVLPECRHKGYGRGLVEFSCGTAKCEEASKLLIGIIDENRVLKEWYGALGFIETEIKRYDHLPFTVCLMEKEL